MNVTLEHDALSPMDLSIPRSKGIVIGLWIATAIFCLPATEDGLTYISVRRNICL